MLACYNLYGEEFGAKRGSSRSTWGTPASIPRRSTERLPVKSTGSGTKSSGERERTVVETLKPTRGGFSRPFGCGWFINE